MLMKISCALLHIQRHLVLGLVSGQVPLHVVQEVEPPSTDHAGVRLHHRPAPRREKFTQKSQNPTCGPACASPDGTSLQTFDHTWDREPSNRIGTHKKRMEREEKPKKEGQPQIQGPTQIFWLTPSPTTLDDPFWPLLVFSSSEVFLTAVVDPPDVLLVP